MHPRPRFAHSILSFRLPWMVSVFWALCLALFPYHTTPASRASLTAPENSFLHVLRTQVSSQPRCLALPRAQALLVVATGVGLGYHRRSQQTSVSLPPVFLFFLCRWLISQPEASALDAGRALAHAWMNRLRRGPTASRGSDPSEFCFGMSLVVP